ncbi:MAG: Alcohol dehydrogenase GroES domain protein [Frondihabitans sp.]|nr:Alcohol dehydrogenase GroES domain protein [Frondihabitans sp.]
MTITAPAPLLRGKGEIAIVDREYRDPGVGELLIAVRANALCGTDRNFFVNGSPTVSGHEAAGVVVAGGRDTTLAPGTRGVVFLMDYCGTCRSCRIGATNQCLAKRADMGINTDGGYGPYEIVHESNFFPITDDIDFPTATMLLDVMGTSGHAIARARLVRPDVESIYISGAGPIGLGLLVMSKLTFGDQMPVFISDVSAWRRDFASTFGGVPIDATDASMMKQVGRPDIAFDSSGKAIARRGALDVLAQRGVLVCVGHGETLTLDVSNDLLAPEHAVLGSEYFRFDELAANLDLLQKHQDIVSRVITHRLPIHRLDEAFDLFLGGETGKVVVVQGGEE